MNNLFVPFILSIVALLFVVTLIFAVKGIKKRISLSYVKSGMIKMPYSEEAEKGVKAIVNTANFPIAIDLVIEHIGKTSDIYVTTEKRYFSRFQKLAEKNISQKYEIREEDYLVFHHGGFTEALACEMNKEEALQTSFRGIDMSKVNEIGEGAAVRMIFIPGREATIQMFFSAPSQFQLREIVEGAAAAFKGKGCHVPKNKELAIAEFNSPDFLYKAAK
ncbi:MAG: hypothetical protein WC519_01485 [Parcubacteria group bacterium]